MIDLLEQIRGTLGTENAIMMEVRASERERVRLLLHVIARKLKQDGLTLRYRTVSNVLDPDGTEEYAVWCE